MAKQRSFAVELADDGLYQSLPFSAQALYFQLSTHADDEGFVSNPDGIKRMIGTTDDDMNILLRTRFVLRFQSGVCVIRHWKLNNTIKKDRFKPTKYTYERSLLDIDSDGAYVERAVSRPVLKWTDGGPDADRNRNGSGTGVDQARSEIGPEADQKRTAPAPQLPSGQNKPQGTGITVIPLSTKIPDSNEQQKYIYNNTHNCCCSETNGDYTDPRDKQETQGDIPQGSTDPNSRDDLVEFIDNLIADMNSRRWESLRELRSEGMSDELVRYAVRRAVDYGHRDWAYVSKILDRWVVEGVRTLEDVAASDARHIPGARSRASPRPNSRLPNQQPELKPGESPFSDGNEWNEQYGTFIPT